MTAVISLVLMVVLILAAVEVVIRKGEVLDSNEQK